MMYGPYPTAVPQYAEASILALVIWCCKAQCSTGLPALRRVRVVVHGFGARDNVQFAEHCFIKWSFTYRCFP